MKSTEFINIALQNHLEPLPLSRRYTDYYEVL